MKSQSAQEDFTATWQLRETQELLKWADSQQALISPTEAVQWTRNLRPGRWQQLVTEAMETLALETQERGLTNGEFREWLSEWARGNRRRQHGLLLTSAHSAKGLEFDHVCNPGRQLATAGKGLH